MPCLTGGSSVEISDMLKRLQAEQNEREKEIHRLKEIECLDAMTSGPVKEGDMLIHFTSSLSITVKFSVYMKSPQFVKHSNDFFSDTSGAVSTQNSETNQSLRFSHGQQ